MRLETDSNRTYRLPVTFFCCWLYRLVTRCDILYIACSHPRHGQDKTVLSCPCRRWHAVWTQLQTLCLDPVSMSFVSSRPSFRFATVQSQMYWGLLKTWKLEIGSRQDKSVLSCLQLCSHRRRGQDKTVLSCLVTRVTAFDRWLLHWRFMVTVSISCVGLCCPRP